MRVIQTKENGWFKLTHEVGFEYFSSSVVDIMITSCVCNTKIVLYNLSKKWQNMYLAAKKNY